MSDNCQPYRDLIAALQDQLAESQQALQQAQQDGIRTDPIQRTIRSLHDQLRAAQSGLLNCLHPPPPKPAPPAQTSNLTIVAVEATQSIQFWTPPPAQGSSFAVSNSIPMVANKQTILRVYVDATTDPQFPIPGKITGTMYLARTLGLPPLQLQPINGPIPALPIGSVQRGTANHTLNFLIPASACIANAQGYVTVFDAAHPGDPLFTSLQFQTLNMYFNPTPALPLHAVLVHYTGLDYSGNNVDATAGGLDLIVTIESFLHRCYPIGDINYTGCEFLDWSERISTNQGICGLKSKIDELRAASGTNDIYVGYYPQEATCGGICGLGGGGSALTKSGDGPEAAHEIGHALGLDHIPCPNMSANNPVSDYPMYDGFPQGSIGEFGFDTVAMRVFDPNIFSDFLSYCAPQWISPYNYIKLWNVIKNQYGTATEMRAKEESLHLGLRIYRDDTADVRWAWQLSGPSPFPRPGAASDITLEVVDRKGDVLDSCRCTADPHAERDHAYVDVSESLHYTNEFAEVRVIRGRRVLTSFKVATSEPTVTINAVKHVEKEQHLVRISWSGGAPSVTTPPLVYAVRYSHDDGRSWRALVAGLTTTHHVVNLDLLPGGEQCLLQIAASAGLRTAVATSEPFAVARKPRRAYIIAPQPDTLFIAGEPIMLAGGGFSPDFGTTPNGEVAWSTPALGGLGTGLRAATRELPPGRHLITLHVDDGLGGEARESVSIRVVNPEEAPCHTKEKSIPLHWGKI